MRPGVTTAIFVATAIVVYTLLPGGTVALIGFEVLILIVAWMAIRRIMTSATADDDEDDVDSGLVGWALWRRFRAPTGKPAPTSLRRIEGLVRFSTRHAYTANERLVPLLRRLASERLAARHGVDLDSDPSRAEAILGAQAWAVLGDGGTGTPNDDDRAADEASLEATVTAIEVL